MGKHVVLALLGNLLTCALLSLIRRLVYYCYYYYYFKEQWNMLNSLAVAVDFADAGANAAGGAAVGAAAP